MTGFGNSKGCVQGDGKTVKILLGCFLSRKRIRLYREQANPLQPADLYVGPEATACHRANAYLTPDRGKKFFKSYRVSVLHGTRVSLKKSHLSRFGPKRIAARHVNDMLQDAST